MDTLRNGQPFGYGKESHTKTLGDKMKASRIAWAGVFPIYSLFYLDARIWWTERMFNMQYDTIFKVQMSSFS